MTARRLFVFGLGYTGLSFAQAMQAQGWRVAGTVRDGKKAAALAPSGISVLAFDGGAPLGDTALLRAASHVLVTIPPTPGDKGPDIVLSHHLPDLMAAPSLAWLGYLSSTGVYGDAGGAWVDESAPLHGARVPERRAADLAWQAAHAEHGLPVHIFRLPGIYGPGRSALERAARGEAKIIDVPGHVFSRVHVDDIAGALEASIARPRPGAIYNVADDAPAAAAKVNAHACRLLGLAPPLAQSLEEADLSPLARGFYGECRRVSNARLKAELGWRPLYPSYREGLAACLAAMTAAKEGKGP
ncbi:MAG: SDR family oxidoreductase [Pseudomonadota bacterium]